MSGAGEGDVRYRLSEVAPDRGAVLRDAEFDRTDYASAATGPVLACAANRTYLEIALRGGAVTALIVPPELADDVPDPVGVLVDADPEIAFYRLQNRLARDHDVQTESFVHPLADLAPGVEIGPGTRIWQFVVILAGARIGARCNLCAHVFVEDDVWIGDDVTVKSGVQLWNGLRVGHGVFIGPNATFTNDHFPRSGVYPDAFPRTVLETGASIGAGAVILPGLTIGVGAMIGAGSVVTRDVAHGTTVVGNPARTVPRKMG